MLFYLAIVPSVYLLNGSDFKDFVVDSSIYLLFDRTFTCKVAQSEQENGNPEPADQNEIKQENANPLANDQNESNRKNKEINDQCLEGNG